MNRGKIYLSIEDLQKLTGGSRSQAYEIHKTIRESLLSVEEKPAGKQKRNLTIWEYCEWSGDNYEHVFFELRGGFPDFIPHE